MWAQLKLLGGASVLLFGYDKIPVIAGKPYSSRNQTAFTINCIFNLKCKTKTLTE